jgi:hypothetical protein
MTKVMYESYLKERGSSEDLSNNLPPNGPWTCGNCFLWTASCFACFLSDPDREECSEETISRGFPEAPIFRPLAMKILELIYHTRNIEDIRLIRRAFRLGLKVLEDLK